MATKTFREEYESIGTFLILELLALICFGLGGVSLIFEYAGFIVAVIATYFAFKSYSKEDLKPILLVAVPLFLMSIFTSFGMFFEQNEGIIERFGAFLSLISFLAIGLSARRLKSFSVKNAIYCIGGGLALITLISTVITWTQYGMFYPLIYKSTPSYYYDGNLYSVLNEMNWLYGFSVVEVSLNYGGLFALLSACALSGLLFVKYEEDKILFIALAVIGGIGLVSIITVTNIYAIIFFVIVALVALYYRFLRNKELANKILHYALLFVAGVAVVLFFFAVLNNSVEAIHTLFENNPFLNRIFNANKIMVVVNPIMEAALKPFNLFGINTVKYYQGYRISNKTILTSTGVFEAEILKEGGIIAFLLFIVFAVMSLLSFARYLKQSKDSDYVKVILLSMLVGFVFYSSFCADVFPITHQPTNYYPITRSLPFFLMIFIIGFTILPKGKAEITFARSEGVQKKEEKKYIDEDYSFSDVEEEEIV